jgi:hypothetical protein
MKKKRYLVLFFTVLIVCSYFYISNRNNDFVRPTIHSGTMNDTALFTLKKGDILVRPNWNWLPGSYPLKNGRKFGHVAFVTEGATGKTIDEALAKASVVEALLFDQATRKFQFSKKDQIRVGKAAVSFGPRFKGIRFRLRMNLTDEQADSMIRFVRNQLDGGYNIFALKKQFESVAERKLALQNLKQLNWHCGTLVWEAYYIVPGVDIDANKGLLVYPSDIIASETFDLPGGRIRF